MSRFWDEQDNASELDDLFGEDTSADPDTELNNL